ncbi:uncharacterized protein G2W53_041622 [Senna tora]|uniref:Uncharacterized protein n=1 Tax=Senna tora TaxID=362788 RepID=A0A834SG04_9FABA|nr:uncharacterized protein G2W53_041622 [Senna tora]
MEKRNGSEMMVGEGEGGVISSFILCTHTGRLPQLGIW